ncbi:CidA/LrgA family protein [Halobacillus sp. Marseille-Q1614]|uniref:CidA/LrgA family protein n=1 Tax=Halobacillus sp. Marseille-Q1614 TaxID=2709134 RepID=UPI00156F72D3|nr:CidA/LrgA family holin-like protein [Halobacillus sp. Marseille-Q1614]
MKIIRITLQISIFYLFYLIGEGLRELLNLSIPGSIIGLVLLFSCLSLNLFSVRWIEEGSIFMLSFLPLFFIPATVGVVNYPSFLSMNGVFLVFIVSVSTLLTMIAAGKISEIFLKKEGGD